MNIFSRRTFLISTALAAIPLYSFAETDAVPQKAFIKNTINSFDFLFQKPPLEPHETISRIQSLWKQHFATQIIARFVLGKYARTANPSQLTRFENIFTEVNSFSLIQRLQDFNKPEFSFTRSLNMKSNTVMVFTEFRTKDGKKIEIGWRVLHRNNSYRIVDIVIAEISMLQTFKSEYNAYLRGNKGDINALITELEEKLLAIKSSVS
jgi:phospholipid transport system substrate-binding protein